MYPLSKYLVQSFNSGTLPVSVLIHLDNNYIFLSSKNRHWKRKLNKAKKDHLTVTKGLSKNCNLETLS